jgi:hypothetical protein
VYESPTCLLIIVSLGYVVCSRLLAIAHAAAATVDETASCCATILVAARGPEPTDPIESRTFSFPFNRDRGIEKGSTTDACGSSSEEITCLGRQSAVCSLQSMSNKCHKHHSSFR